MSAGLTNTGETRINQLLGNGGDLIIDRFVLANIAGLDPDTAIDKTMGMPEQAEIVHTYAIPENYKGYIDPNQVVYSMILGADVGDFTFNSLFLVEASTDNVIAIAKTGDQEKFATDLQINKTGNTLTRNFMIGFQDAQTLTGITIEAESWQLDFSHDFNIHVNKTIDTSQTGSEGKHVTESQAKKWEDHADDPHDYSVSTHDHDTRYCTEVEAQTKVDDAVSSIMNAPPATLDTLNELAAALGDDPNFATTMANALASKETPAGAQAKVDALIPSGTKMYFYQNIAPTGWTIDSTLTDRVLAIKGGTFGSTGGTTAGTWTQPNHAHTVSIPVHNHQYTRYYAPNYDYSYDENGNEIQITPIAGAGYRVDWNTGTAGKDVYTANNAESTPSSSSNATANTWRPAAAVGIIATKN